MSIYLGNTLIAGNPANIDKVAQEIPLGASKYSKDVLEPDAGWLKSSGQWNDGTVYTTFYTTALNKIGDDFSNGKIVASTDTYTDYDLVINTTNQTFRLPLLDGTESFLPDESYRQTLSVPASGVVVDTPVNGLVSLWISYSGSFNSVILYNKTCETEAFILDNGTGNAWTSGDIRVNSGDGFYISYPNLPSDAHMELYFMPFVGNGDLYYKVDNALQNIALLNVGQITNALTLKADKDLSNTIPVQAFKNSTMDWSMADFSSRIFVEETASDVLTYTAPAKGIIIVGQYVYAGDNASLTVNGYTVIDDNTHTSSMAMFKIITLAVNQGDVIVNTSSAGAHYGNLTFFPMKGV